jgi:hypothetical protein
MKCRRCEKPFMVSAADDEFDGGLDDEVEQPTRSRTKIRKRKMKATSGKTVRVACADCGTRFQAEIRQKSYETSCIVCDQPVPVPGKDAPTKTPAKKTVKRKKRASARSKERRKLLIPLLIGTVCIAGVVGLLFLLPNMGSKKGEIEPPEAYTVYEDKVGNQFRVDYPQGWEVKSGGRGTSNPWARFMNGSATIRVKTSMGASALGDIMGIGGYDEDTPDELTAVAQIHTFMKEQYAEEYSDYDEQPATMIETGMGKGQFSEFTAAGSWGSKIKGVRLTCLAVNYQFTVLCDCPEADWAVCRPIFEHVAKSLSH